jgi:hypothetical protein
MCPLLVVQPSSAAITHMYVRKSGANKKHVAKVDLLTSDIRSIAAGFVDRSGETRNRLCLVLFHETRRVRSGVFNAVARNVTKQ